MALTAEQKRRYLEEGGARCPFCDSDDIEGTGEHETDGTWHSAEVRCNSCQRTWEDLYTLTDVDSKDT